MMKKKHDIKEKMFGSKKVRGLIIAGILAIVYIFVYRLNLPLAIWAGIQGALALTIGIVIREAFEIKESWALFFGLLLIFTTITFLIWGSPALVIFAPIWFIMILIYIHQKRFPKKKSK